MKRMILLLCLLLTLCGCGRADPETGGADYKPFAPEIRSDAEAASAASVRLRYAGGTYEPTLWMVCSYSGGVAADATRIQPQEAAAELTDAMWITLPVSFEYGTDLRRSDFTLYRMDENGGLLSPAAAGDSEGIPPGSLYWFRRMGDFTAPEEPGRYLCIGEVSFGTDSRYTGSQYVFAFEVPVSDGSSAVPVRLQHAGGAYTPELYTVSSRSAEREYYAAPIQALQAAETLTEDMWVTLPAEFGYGDGLQSQE